MHLSNTINALVAGLLVTSVAADPARNLLPRATSDINSVCSSSYNILTSSRPTPTDKSLSSWLAEHTTTTADVPPSLRTGYCTYDTSRAAWAKSTALPFVSKCSDWLKPSDASSFSSFVVQHTTPTSWCSSYAHNGAPARETGFMRPGVMVAAGLVAAVL